MGGSAPRILSIDDYYLMDESGPVWNEEQERQYKLNLLKSFKRNLEDGHFSFIIVDTLNLKASDLMDLSEPARLRGFAVFLVDLPERGTPGTTRHCTEKDIEVLLFNGGMDLFVTNSLFELENEKRLATSTCQLTETRHSLASSRIGH